MASYLPARQVQQRRFTVSHTDKRSLPEPSLSQTPKLQRTSIDTPKRKQQEVNYGSTFTSRRFTTNVNEAYGSLLQQRQDQEDQPRISTLHPATFTSPDLELFNKGNGVDIPKFHTDPRDIKSPEFQRNAIHNIIAYLTIHHYGGVVTRRTLRSLASRDFQAIFKFLHNRLDPSYTYTKLKFEDEILDVLRILSYPFVDSISPKSLYSIAAPHSLPTFLALLSWMVDVCKVNDVLQGEIERHMDQEADIHINEEMGPDEMSMLFFDYSVSKYNAFMQGDDHSKFLDDELNSVFEAINEGGIERIKQVLVQKEKLQDDRKRLDEHMKLFNGIRQKKMATEQRIAQLNDDIEYQKRRETKYNNANSELERQTAKLSTAMTSLKDEMEVIRASIKDPHLTDTEIDELSSQQAKWDQEVETSSTKLQEIQQLTWQNEMQVEKQRSEIEQAMAKYNNMVTKMDRISLDGTGLSTISNLTTPLDFNPNDLDDMISNHLEQHVIPDLEQLQSKLKEIIPRLEKQDMELQQEWQRLQAQLRKQRQENQDLEVKLSRKQRVYEEAEENARQENMQYQKNREESKRILQEMRREATTQLIRTKHQEQIMQLQMEKMKSKISEHETKMMEELEQLVKVFNQAMTHFSSKLNQTDTDSLDS
ncbi:HEC/Ndc80p family-domain-containing protein [Halteromyces radiatus]|uniref:HEC/Ndc80p family-domain-containing protein n=1 Tax=Halteromyces radiatus TaxID=101107 RepID=UPI00221F85B7|nr:HEC/Ndc80p family-domain-containing protein [Halteromyces radiatus]KAI8096216.1 HEC/Ndc80p family-domain-containing protein [Halteromyces radiatus]